MILWRKKDRYDSVAVLYGYGTLEALKKNPNISRQKWRIWRVTV